MTRRQLRTFACCAIGVLALAACGGGGDSDDDSSSDDTTSEVEADDTEETEASADTETPEVTDAPVASVVAVDILTDFGDVCRGVSLPGATAYDPARTGVHPMVTLGGEAPTYETLANLPDQWAPVIGEEQTVELVACLDRTSATLVQTCDGYLDDDGEDTGNTVEMYDATYDVRLVAATTGDVIATTQLDATDDVCPSFVFFDADETVKPWYAEPTDALTAFLAPYVEI